MSFRSLQLIVIFGKVARSTYVLKHLSQLSLSYHRARTRRTRSARRIQRNRFEQQAQMADLIVRGNDARLCTLTCDGFSRQSLHRCTTRVPQGSVSQAFFELSIRRHPGKRGNSWPSLSNSVTRASRCTDPTSPATARPRCVTDVKHEHGTAWQTKDSKHAYEGTVHTRIIHSPSFG